MHLIYGLIKKPLWISQQRNDLTMQGSTALIQTHTENNGRILANNTDRTHLSKENIATT